jgi:hypothetical protein
MTLYTCAISGNETGAKHYILKTTEGEELVCAEALFHVVADANTGRLLLDLISRVEHLEAALEELHDEDQAADAGPIAKAAAKAAAPVKKAPVKKAGA